MRGILVCCGVALAFALPGCSGDEEEEPAPRARPAEVREATPPQPPQAAKAEKAEKALTVDALLAAKRGVKPYDDWAAASKHLTAAAGPPSRVDGEVHGWYVRAGDECFVLEVVRDPAQQRVDSVLYGPFGRDATEFARCPP